MIDLKLFKKFIERVDKIDTEQIKIFLNDFYCNISNFLRVLDFNNEGFIIFDTEGIVKYANITAAEVLKFETPEELIDKSIQEVIYNKDIKYYLINKIKKQEPIIEEEHIMGVPHIRVMRTNLIPIRDNTNKVILFLFRFVDITRKKMEEIKNRRQDNIESMKHLASGLAHEIKNPLASITIHLDLILRYISKLEIENIKKDIYEIVNILKDEVQRLNSIVQDFLSSIRPISLDLTKVDIIELIKDVIKFLSYELEEKKITIEFSPEDNLPPVLGDQKYLRVVFLNLIKNAMEAFDNVKRDKKLITIKMFENHPYIEIIIKDNGKGIEPKNIEKIFTPYFTTKETGNGIGLTLVHKIISEHHGNIRVESEVNVGTTFYIILPSYKGESKKYLP
ncbi:MAG TPA: ATP-binding protein [Spirochaetota bacterium]|nr:ATP-binding protein [Spirochaetota bacterium]HOM37628.1 ATP-binding protein [Spirochaetota bacterium]HPQ49401.1 ATP-binding protein [Spirochaetota bacterium]